MHAKQTMLESGGKLAMLLGLSKHHVAGMNPGTYNALHTTVTYTQQWRCIGLEVSIVLA